ncbi:MAG: acylneuraminate cytidylyltransferase family protein [Lachnospiraceae bacterium]|nr:acylneuraminate cytidylyltransferase family protein [Lachnospiraceae bacterium]
MGNIAIIPARSGSKGLPDKNIIDLAGKPLMYYTIKAALNSGCFEEVMVSTNSEKYAGIAHRFGANVPFLRSEEMSGDSASSWDTVREVLLNYEKAGKKYKYVALLQPTSPLRDAEDIRNVFEFLSKTGANNAVTVTETDHPVQWCFRLPVSGMMDEMAASQYNYMRRQELEKYYRENGAMYLVDASKIVKKDYNFYADKCAGYIMPREKSIDIDTKVDLIIAKTIIEDYI